MVIIVRRPYAYLAEELSREFAGQEDVHVIVDRRYGERRRWRESVTVERRQGNRRNPKEEIVEMALTT
jgi:hypothetical protein